MRLRKYSQAGAVAAVVTALAVTLSPSPAHAETEVWQDGRECPVGRTAMVQSKAASSEGGDPDYIQHHWVVGGTYRFKNWYQPEAETLTTRYSLTYHRITTYAHVAAEVISSASLNCVQ